MPAGKRRFKITVQSATEADDAGGQPQQTWSTYCQAWADVEMTGGSERFRGRQISAQATHVAEVLADSNTRAITPGMRFIWEGRILNIKIVRPLDGMRKMIELQATEVVAP
ncbi:MAG: head-tail adaptor protein [Rhizobium sp.]|nr:MAG: head-tail adaptor protein [Rhizobium sp.]